MTTIGDALLELKAKRSQLTRLYDLRASSFRRRTADPPLAKGEHFDELTADIAAQVADIRKLKMQIENTNHATYVDTPQGKMTIAEAIHYVSDMRSDLAQLQGLKERFTVSRYLSEDEESKHTCQLTQRELLEKIAHLESAKVRMDAFLTSRNWAVKLQE